MSFVTNEVLWYCSWCQVRLLWPFIEPKIPQTAQLLEYQHTTSFLLKRASISTRFRFVARALYNNITSNVKDLVIVSAMNSVYDISFICIVVHARGGIAAAAPPLFRPSDPALCGSHPLVTPCRLGGLLCFVFIV